MKNSPYHVSDHVLIYDWYYNDLEIPYLQVVIRDDVGCQVLVFSDLATVSSEQYIKFLLMNLISQRNYIEILRYIGDVRSFIDNVKTAYTEYFLSLKQEHPEIFLNLE